MDEKTKRVIITGAFSLGAAAISAFATIVATKSDILDKLNDAMVMIGLERSENIAELLTNIENISKENNQLKVDLNEFKTANTQLLEENNSLRLKNESLELKDDEINALTQQLNSYKSENENIKKQLNDFPVIEFKDLGFSVNGEDKNITKSKSMVLVNGNQYFSKDFLTSLVSPKDFLSIKDDILYVGKIIKDKELLVNQWVMDSKNCKVVDTVTDSYGHTYSNALLFSTQNAEITYSLNEDFSMLKGTIAIESDASVNLTGVFQILADDVLVYPPLELRKVTEPVEIDIPINNAKLLTIKYTHSGIQHSIRCIFTNVTVYNN